MKEDINKTKEAIELFDELIADSEQQAREVPDFYEVHGYVAETIRRTHQGYGEKPVDEEVRFFSMDDIKSYPQLHKEVREGDWAMDKMGGIMRCSDINVEIEANISGEAKVVPTWSVYNDQPPGIIQEALNRVVALAEEWDRKAPGRLSYQINNFETSTGGILDHIANTSATYDVLTADKINKIIKEIAGYEQQG